MRTKYHVARPGIRVGGKRRGRDLFTLARKTARRFTFVKVNGKNVAREFDSVTRSKLTVVNWKFGNKPEPKGKTRLLLNPAVPRKLVIDGKSRCACCSWVGGAALPGSRCRPLMPGDSHARSCRRCGPREAIAPARAPAS